VSLDLELLVSEIREASAQTPRHRPSAASTFGKVSHHPDIAAYLTHCVCDDGYLAEGLQVCGFSRLLQENHESAALGKLIHPHGFLVLATSIGGNALCADAGTGHVYWFGHSQFTEHWIMWKDAETGELREADEYSPENIRAAGIKVADSVEKVFHDLFAGELGEFIKKHG
jgi:hypothetical protein